eukprot:m.65900 g.65900  ORF g.65900 m.65900 type:complete len:228 (+) comp23616_c0_seq1:84-767(+)
MQQRPLLLLLLYISCCDELFAYGAEVSVNVTSTPTRSPTSSPIESIPCSELFEAQICCAPPEIDLETQQPKHCTRENKVALECFVAQGVFCNDTVFAEALTNTTENSTLCGGKWYNRVDAFHRVADCYYINPEKIYQFNVALGLSVFLGPFGVDRFYLGHYGMGLAKLATGGFALIGWLVDVVLITLQIVGPADGSSYYMPYYGPRSIRMSTKMESETFEDFQCDAR